MGLFSPSLPYDESILEGSVTNVDPIRFVCTVKTIRGQYFNEVPWLLPTGGSGKAGMHFTPAVGDQVVISTGLTYPIILGALPKLGLPSTSLTSLSGSELPYDTGNNTNLKNGYVTNPAKPSDFTPGDQVWTSPVGSLWALLANGSILLKSSSLAQIFISKFDDLVRVVARNWERFSDIGQQTVANVGGRLYEYLGWDRSLGRAKVGIYELQDVVGDVALGEVIKGEPHIMSSPPAVDNRVRKYSFTDQAGHPRMVDVLYDDGALTVLVQDAPATTKTDTVTHNDLWQKTSTSPSNFARIKVTPDNVTVTYNDAATTVHDATGIRSTFSGHFVNIDSSGVHIG